MLVIRVELWPHGDETRAEIIGHASIGNLGHTKEAGSECRYSCRVREDANPITHKPAQYAGFEIEHNRRNSVWALVQKVIKEYLARDTA